LFCGLFAGLISILHAFKVPVAHPEWANVVPTLVLGLLLVFRTNTAYERFWEGRKLWGAINNTSRNLGRQIWVAIDEPTPDVRDQKVMALNLIAAFASATKQHLRSAPVADDVTDLVTPEVLASLENANHPPIEISVRIAAFFGRTARSGKPDAISTVLDASFTRCFGGFPRRLRANFAHTHALRLCHSFAAIAVALLPHFAL